jgi:ubiquinone biosynthesis protein COQ9
LDEYSTILMDEIVLAALPNVPFEGMNMNAVYAGAMVAKSSVDKVDILFPNGIRSFIDHWSQLADRLLVKEITHANLNNLKIRERIALLVRTRLSRWYSNKDAIRGMVGLAYLPAYHEDSVVNLYKTVDAIWYLAGDQSVDFNFYTKRLLLAGVFSSTVLFWLNDNSHDSKASWEFLDRRISDIMLIPKLRAKLEGLTMNCSKA